MKVNFVKEIKTNKDSSVVVQFVTQEIIENHIKQKSAIATLIEGFKFSGNIKETLEFKKVNNYKKLILVGLGDESKLNETILQKIGGYVATIIAEEEEVFVEIQVESIYETVVESLILGMQLKAWSFDRYFSNDKDKKTYKTQTINFVVKDTFKANKVGLDEVEAIVSGVNFARNLINEPANVLFPKTYVERLKDLEKSGLDIEILKKQDLEKQGMGALLSVSQGSSNEPYVVVIRHNGGAPTERPVAFVGKGVTFDTGGYSLKPGMSMIGMKKDMAGSATVVGVMQTLSLRKAKINAVGVIGLVDNCVSSAATKPGDIIKSMSGKTIEVLNTDAEGRLVLADILWYTKEKIQPQFMVNIATLTGAIIISLGEERAGLFSNNTVLSDRLMQSGSKTGELVWSMPVGDEYADYLKSSVADLQNISTSMKGGGSIFAAMFLKEFVGECPWAHLDIAGVSSISKSTEVDQKGCIAFGVRLLNCLVKDYYENKPISQSK